MSPMEAVPAASAAAEQDDASEGDEEGIDYFHGFHFVPFFIGQPVLTGRESG